MAGSVTIDYNSTAIGRLKLQIRQQQQEMRDAVTNPAETAAQETTQQLQQLGSSTAPADSYQSYLLGRMMPDVPGIPGMPSVGVPALPPLPGQPDLPYLEELPLPDIRTSP